MSMRRQAKHSTSAAMAPATKLLVFDSHPIQYRSPVFASLSQTIDTHVCYFGETFSGRRWWFREFDKAPAWNFNIPIKKGFKNETLQYNTPIQFIRRVHRVLIQERPTAVLVYGYYLWEHWLVFLVAKATKIPIIFVGETFTLGQNHVRRWLKKIFLPLFFRAINHIVTIGDKNKSYYESLGVSANKITPARYCVDGQFFELSATDAAQARRCFRKKHGIGEDDFILLFVGRLFARKRPMDVLEIHSRLFSRYAHLYSVIVGSGELESRLRSECSHLPRAIMTGFLNQEQIRDIYYAADCLIVPSEFETWGLVVNEAMHCAVPAIITETCGV